MGSVVIVGAGAIGSWLAVRMSGVDGSDVSLLAREENAMAIAVDGLSLEVMPVADPEGRGHTDVVSVPRLRVADEASELPREPDLVVFAVRAYQTREAAVQLAEAGVSPKSVLTLQNGLGNAEALADVFGAERVVAGTTTHGVTWVEPTRVRHAGAGDTTVGPWHPDASPLAHAVVDLLCRSGIETRLVDDPRAAVWTKVAVNAAINPPTALHGIANGALLDGGDLERDLERAAEEVARVARAEGVDVDVSSCVSQARRVADRTAANMSSMLQARRSGRPLEVDAIVGEPVRRAHRHGIDVPTLEAHLAALSTLP